MKYDDRIQHETTHYRYYTILWNKSKKKEKTIQHDTGWNITTKYNMKQNIKDTIQYCGTEQKTKKKQEYDRTWHKMKHYDKIQYETKHYDTIQYNTPEQNKHGQKRKIR